MNSFEWIHPRAFIFILPLIAVWVGLALYSRSQKRKAAAAFVSAAMQPRIVPPESPARFWSKTALFAAALVFGLLALARPRFGVYYEDVKARGSDIYILIDVSRSMLANDVPPSRLERAKSDVLGLLTHLHGERVGLIAFAGVAVVKSPLTTDYNFFRLALNELSPRSVPKGGTQIGDAIRKALDVLPKNNEREQALLLITDGDDQDSYALDAAALAAERSVTIFTVGLGDTAQGSRIPLESESFLTYKGEQVWSKMGEQLLKDIALKTHGAYVPARTNAYDLGELYADHLAKMRSAEGATQKRMRLSEQYQWFLALAVLCLIAEMLVRLYKPQAPPLPVRVVSAQGAPPSTPEIPAKTDDSSARKPNPPAPFPKREGGELHSAPAALKRIVMLAALLSGGAALTCAGARASDEQELVRQGLELYKKSEFDGARDRFEQAATAAEQQKQRNAAEVAVAAFDLACAYQRKGDRDHARENYLKAAMSPEKSVSASSRFNLGCLSADAARELAGDKPEEVPPEKRNDILEKLKEAVASYRLCLEIQPGRADARQNLETIRSWVKVYSDKWRELDKKKQRDQANLIQYLEFITETQRALRTAVLDIPPGTTLDVYALHKQAQRELLDEIEPLKEKIRTSLKPSQQPGQPGQANPAPPKLSPEEEKQLNEAIGMLIKLADAAGTRMKTAAELLDGRTAGSTEKSAAEQKQAIAELEKIWDAVVPFNLLLAHDIAAETVVVNTLKPDSGSATDAQKSLGKVFDWFGNLLTPKKDGADSKSTPPQPQPSPVTPAASVAPKFDVDPKEDGILAELQERTQHRTELLKIKADLELQQLDKQPQPPAPPPPGNDPNGSAAKVQGPDPEAVKKGLRKAVELAPKAAEHMNGALKALRKNDRPAATPEAVEAKRILEEILKAQPQDPKKDEQDKKDRQKKDQEKKDQEKKDQEKKDQEKKDQQQNPSDKDKDKDKEKDREKEKKDEQKKDQDKNKPDDKEQKDKEKDQMSREQAEALLRKVREREQQHRKDKDEQARILGGSISVEKDW